MAEPTPEWLDRIEAEFNDDNCDLFDWARENGANVLAALRASWAERDESVTRWETLKGRLFHWVETDEPGTESQATIGFVQHIMAEIEEAK